MKDNSFIKSLQKGLNKDNIASYIHHHLDNCIINGECCNVDNGEVTSCWCIANMDRNKYGSTTQIVSSNDRI